MSSSTPAARRHQVLLLLVGLAAPLALGVTADAASSAPAQTVERAPAQRYITALVNKKLVRKGKKVTITGTVNSPGVPACTNGVILHVQRSTRAAIYKVVGTFRSDPATGAYRVKAVVKKKSRFRIVAPASAACVEAQSPPRTVKIKPPRR